MPAPLDASFSLLVRKRGHPVWEERGDFADLLPKWVRLAREAGMPVGALPGSPSNIRCDLGETTILLVRDAH